MHLEGVRILDLTRLLPGPYATQMLADMGADVIKIEDPDTGDYARDIPPLTDRGFGSTFDMLNRGKRSVAIDLKNPDGRAVFLDLAREADVVFEQFRPGVVDRLNVGYEEVSTVNEEVVYCSLSGYGQEGPYANRAGHDLNYVGMGGLLDMTRESDEMKPQLIGYPIADLTGGLVATLSILGALLSRELGGKGGEYIDVAMTDVIVSLSSTIAWDALTGNNPRPGETRLTGKYPSYEVYETADGRYLTLAAIEPKFWRAFCEKIMRPDLFDHHRASDPGVRETLRDELEAVFEEKTLAEWMDELGPETTVAPVCTPAEMFDHPHMVARELTEYDGEPPRVGFPAMYADGRPCDRSCPPSLGEHTAEVLSEAGFDDVKIDHLQASGVVGKTE